MEKFFKSLSGVFAALPGVAILLSSLGVPNPEDKLIFGGIIEAIGCGTLGLIYINRNFLCEQALKKISLWVIICFTSFLFCIIVYIILYSISVKEYEDFSRVYFPLFPSKELQNEINAAGGKFEFVEKWFGDGANKQIQKLSATQLIITNIIFLVIYQFIFTTLTIGFGLLGIREAKMKLSIHNPPIISI